MLITFVYVDKAFRGLGLGNELLQALQKYCKEQNVRMILAHNAFVPDVFSKILMKNNFEKINGVFFAFVLD